VARATVKGSPYFVHTQKKQIIEGPEKFTKEIRTQGKVMPSAIVPIPKKMFRPQTLKIA